MPLRLRRNLEEEAPWIIRQREEARARARARHPLQRGNDPPRPRKKSKDPQPLSLAQMRQLLDGQNVWVVADTEHLASGNRWVSASKHGSDELVVMYARRLQALRNAKTLSNDEEFELLMETMLFEYLVPNWTDLEDEELAVAASLSRGWGENVIQEHREQIVRLLLAP